MLILKANLLREAQQKKLELDESTRSGTFQRKPFKIRWRIKYRTKHKVKFKEMKGGGKVARNCKTLVKKVIPRVNLGRKNRVTFQVSTATPKKSHTSDKAMEKK